MAGILDKKTRFMDSFLTQTGREQLAKGELKQLMKITNFNKEEISNAISVIRSLNPKPGEAFLFDETIQNSPDVIVTKGNKGWVVELNKSTLPAVVIDENYISKLDSKKQTDNSSFIADSTVETKFLISSEVFSIVSLNNEGD